MRASRDLSVDRLRRRSPCLWPKLHLSQPRDELFTVRASVGWVLLARPHGAVRRACVCKVLDRSDSFGRDSVLEPVHRAGPPIPRRPADVRALRAPKLASGGAAI